MKADKNISNGHFDGFRPHTRISVLQMDFICIVSIYLLFTGLVRIWTEYTLDYIGYLKIQQSAVFYWSKVTPTAQVLSSRWMALALSWFDLFYVNAVCALCSASRINWEFQTSAYLVL